MTHSLNFLHEAEPKPVQQARKRRKGVRAFLVLCFLLLLVWVVALVGASLYVMHKSYLAVESIRDAESAAQDFAFSEASRDLEVAESYLASAQRGLPVLRTAVWVPLVGMHVESVADLIDAGHDLSAALQNLFELGEELVRLSGLSEQYLRDAQLGLEPEVTFNDLSVETKRAILTRLSRSASDLDLFAEQLHIIAREIERLSHSKRIAPLLSIFSPVLEHMELVREQLEVFSVVAKLLPSLGGLEDSSTILVLFLNNDEIRPGGGFIGSYGVLVMDGGDIQSLETADVYDLDDAVADQVTRIPPYPLTAYNASDKWFFRDANWSPDFAVSSQTALELFSEEVAFLKEVGDAPVADEVDHVMAFTPVFASALLEIVGDITVGGQTFTSENVSELLEYQVQFAFAENGIPYAQRKEILADLIAEMKERLFALPSDQWPLVVEAVQEALIAKQMGLYSTDDSTQEIIERSGWGGRVSEEMTGDSLMVVDANLASLKSDPAVEREIRYEIEQGDVGEWVGRVRVMYTHNGSFNWRTTRYRTYTRVYVPLGSEFKSSSGTLANDKTQNPSLSPGHVDQYEELGRQVYGAFTAVEPGAQQELVFEFTLSPDVVEQIKNGSYELTVLKQMGAFERALTLDLDFGKTLTRAVPSETMENWGDQRYFLRTNFDQDTVFRVEF